MVYVQKEKAIIVVQARMGSTRLPGKILKRFLSGLTMLELLLRRLKQCQTIDEIIVAYPGGNENDVVNRTVANEQVSSIRGSEEDVLDRFYRAALSRRPGIIARVCADNPLTDPRVIDHCINAFKNMEVDYLMPKGLPPGTFAEIFSIHALEVAWEAAKDPVDREHVTSWMRSNTKDIKQHYLKMDRANWVEDSFTVDTAQDFQKIDSLIARLGGDGTNITLEQLNQ